MNAPSLRRFYVERIYADHNFSPAVREHLAAAVASLGPEGIGLNVGSGHTRIHPRIRNVDVAPAALVDYRASALALPFPDETFDLIVTQETLEHVPDPFKAMEEMARVLKPGGTLYVQLPFIIGFHPGPMDYWRFTTQGMRELADRVGLTVTTQAITVGGASGYYRISVEFWSGLLSLGRKRPYKALKGAFALLLYPLKWLDPLFNRSPERDRIPGGYLIVARKN